MITEHQLEDISEMLNGTCDSIESALSRLDLEDKLDVSEVEDRLLDVNLERCPHCEWWCESGELVDDDGNVVGCDSCRTHNDDDDE